MATGRTRLAPATTPRCGSPASPGLVLFSSGSTGKHKAAVHDLRALLKKFTVPRHCYRTLVFLQLDHIGGVNTLFYTLSNGGAVVVSEGRTPRQVCEAIATHRVELLPTSPTFLNLLLLSEEHQRHDLSSLKLITYGTEPMPEITLRKVHAAFPRGQAAADLRPERARHPAVAVARVRLALGARRRRGLRDQDRRRPALHQGELGDARLPERAEPVRRRRLLRHRRPRGGRRRVAPHPRPQERDHQRRRQQGVSARGRERAARARQRRGRGGARRAEPDHRPDRRRHRPADRRRRMPPRSRRG